MDKKDIKIAVLSGKGGTGKTFVAVNIASVSPDSTYADCDVEEPNGMLFFKPDQITTQDVNVMVPVFFEDACTGCRECVSFCRFNALSFINQKVTVFDDICHACGGCVLVCPHAALKAGTKSIGRIHQGKSADVTVVSGELNIGEPSGVPIISRINEIVGEQSGFTVIDGPPGSACTVMESINDVNYCVLVAEPTQFGLHNLKMVKELLELKQIPYGVVLNKCTEADNPVEDFCMENSLPVLGRLPFNQTLAEQNAEGRIISRVDDTYKSIFTDISNRIKEAAR